MKEHSNRSDEANNSLSSLDNYQITSEDLLTAPNTIEEARDILLMVDQGSISFTTVIDDYLNKKYPLNQRIGKRYALYTKERQQLIDRQKTLNNAIKTLERVNPDFFLLQKQVDHFRADVCKKLFDVENS